MIRRHEDAGREDDRSVDRFWPALTVAAVSTLIACPAAASPRDFDIRAQPLADALREFSVQSGQPVFFSKRSLGRAQSTRLRARAESAVALRTLLADTGFSAVPSGEGYAIIAIPPRSPVTKVPRRPSSEQPSARLLQDIIVTADRSGTFGVNLVQAGTFRGARLIDTPMTIGVVPRELLDAQQARSVQDAVRNTAGVTNTTTNGAVYSNLAIRGIPVENRSNYRLDGSLPVVNLIDQPMEDKDRVEVLKGVASLYYGFSTPAGVVNMTLKRPARTPVRAATLFGGSGGGAGVHIDVSQPLGNNLGIRVNLVQAGVGYGVTKVEGARALYAATMDWSPLSALTLKIAAERIEKRVTEPSNFQLFIDANGNAVLPPLLDPGRGLASRWMIADNRETNLLARGEYRFAPDWTVAIEGGLSDLLRDRVATTIRNYDGAGNAAIQQIRTANGNHHRNANGRIELSGAFEAMGLVHTVTVGVTSNHRLSEIPLPLTVDVPIDIYNPAEIAPIAAPARTVPNPSRIVDDGLYAFDRVSYRNQIDVLVGLRGTRYSISAPMGPNYTLHSLSPSVAVVVKPVPELSLYATYIEGLEEGGVAPNNAINVGEVLGPAVTRQREIGAKFQVTPTLLVTGSWFSIDRQSAFVNTAGRFVDDGRSLYTGVEIGASGQLVPRLQISFSGQVLSTEQSNAADATLLGKQVENAPRTAMSLFAEYDVAAIKGLSVNGGVFQTGARAVNNANQAFVPGYALANLGARYRRTVGKTPMVFAVAAENVTGERYYAATGGGLIGLGLPSSIRFSIGAQF